MKHKKQIRTTEIKNIFDNKGTLFNLGFVLMNVAYAMIKVFFLIVGFGLVFFNGENFWTWILGIAILVFMFVMDDFFKENLQK
jgi:hypothetical protein